MARSPASRARGVLGNGLSPICSSMTSLPCPFSLRATASTSKAVSAERPRAKRLSSGMAVGSRRSAIRRGGIVGYLVPTTNRQLASTFLRPPLRHAAGPERPEHARRDGRVVTPALRLDQLLQAVVV